jgi:phiEco32-like amidoligase-type 2 protein
MDEDLSKQEFEPVEEAELAEVKSGEWYLWETEGSGLSRKLVFYINALYPEGCDVLYSSNPAYGGTGILQSGYLKLPAWHAQLKSAGQVSKLWRPKQQPKISWKDWKTNLAAAAWAVTPTTGTDPELFVEDAAGNVIPAWEFLPAKGASALFWDGFQAEFMVTHGGCQDSVGGRIAERLRQLSAQLPPGARLSTRSVVEIPPGLMRTASSEHIDFGCRPSLNAYGLAGEVIADPRLLPIRFAGGHIHWGIDKTFSEAQVTEAVKFVDLVAGLISVSISEGLDDPRRRRYYGLAGEFRLPEHGVEYRTLSNSWLLYPAVYHLLFTTGRLALRLGLVGRRTEFSKVPEIAVVNAINNTDVELARKLIQEDHELFEEIFRTCWPSHVEATMSKALSSMTTWGIDLTRIRDNWSTLGGSGYTQRWSDFMFEGPLKLDKVTNNAKSTGALLSAGTANSPEPGRMPNVSGDADIIRSQQSRA